MSLLGFGLARYLEEGKRFDFGSWIVIAVLALAVADHRGHPRRVCRASRSRPRFDHHSSRAIVRLFLGSPFRRHRRDASACRRRSPGRSIELTHDPFALGMVGLAQFAPMFALTLYAGDVADRFERRLILCGQLSSRRLCRSCSSRSRCGGVTATWPYFATLVLFGAARAFSGPGVAIVPAADRSPAQDLPRAIAVSSSVFQVAVISGPALGGAALVLRAGRRLRHLFGLFVSIAPSSI